MEKERIFVAFAKINEDGEVRTESALLTPEQLNVVFWLYNRGFLKGTYESNDDICIDEP